MPLDQDLQLALDNLRASSSSSLSNLDQALSNLTRPTVQPKFNAGTIGNAVLRGLDENASNFTGYLDAITNSDELLKQNAAKDMDIARINEALAAEQAGTATPEQLKYLDTPVTIQEKGTQGTGAYAASQALATPKQFSPREIYESMRNANINPISNPIEKFIKEKFEDEYELPRGTLANSTWSDLQAKTLGSLVNREAEDVVANQESFVEGSKKFADALQQVDEGRYVESTLNLAGAIKDFGLGVAGFTAENPVLAAELAAGELAGLLFSSGGNLGEGHNAYRQAIQEFTRKNNRLPTPEELTKIQAGGVAVAAMDAVSDKMLKNILKTEGATSLTGKAAQTIAASYKEGIAEGGQQVIQGLMDLEGLSYDEAIEAYEAAAQGGVVGGGISAGSSLKGGISSSVDLVKKVANDYRQGKQQKAESVKDTEEPTETIVGDLVEDEPTIESKPEPLDESAQIQEGITIDGEVVPFEKLEPIGSLPAPTKDSSKAQRTFYSFRRNQESLSAEEMNQLADEDNDLTEAQNNELRAAAQLATSTKDSSSVGKEITVGGGEKLSIPQHTQGIKQAIRSGDINQAKELANQFQTWANYQNAKAQAYTKSFTKTSLSPQDLEILGKNAQGKIKSINSQALVNQVTNEADVMNKQLDAINNYLKAVEATDAEIDTTTAPKVESVSEAQPEAPITGQGDVFTDGGLPPELTEKLTQIKEHIDTAIMNAEDPTMKEMTAIEALEIMGNNPEMTEPFEAYLVNVLKKLLKNTDVKVSMVDDGNFGTNVAAHYSPDLKTVFLTPSNASLQTLLHEMIHAVTSDIIRKNPSKRSEDQNQAIKDLESLRKIVEKHIKDTNTKGGLIEYGLTNLEEFLAVGFTNPEFQTVLKNIPIKSTNAFTKFTQMVRKLLGIPESQETAFEQLLDLGIQLAKEQAGIKQEQIKVEPEQEAKEQPEVGKLVSVNGKPGFITGFDKKGNARVQLGNKSVSVNPEELKVSKHKLNTVDYKGKQYLVTAKGSIMSTASGEIVFKKDNKTRREILAIASGKTPEVIAESVAEDKPEQIVKPEETNEVAEQIDEEPEVVTKKPDLPEFSLSKKLLSATGYNPDLPLKEQNLIKHWFKTGKNNSALETVDNFMEALNQDPKVVEAFISDMTDAQKQSFRNFYKFHREMLPKLDAEWVAKDSFQYKDFTQFMTTDGKLDPNVKTAIILGAYEYLVDKTESSQWKSQDDVKRILGVPDSTILPDDVYQEFVGAGDVSSTVWDSIGASAASALNLKPTNDAGMNAKALLNSSLAAWAKKLLEDNDLIINTRILPNIDWLDDNGEPIVNTTLMTKVNKEKALPLIQGAKVDPYVTNEVFGTTKVRSLPEFKPSKAPMKFKGSNQKIPKRMREAITKHNKRPQVVIKAMDSLISQMSQAAIYEMLGYEFDLGSVVKGKRKSVEAVNRSIENSYQNWLDFREYQNANGGIDTEFFYNHTPATNNRLFLDSRMNPQSDKFHRFMVGSKGWETTVDPKDKKAMTNFMLAVAEGMDIEAAKDTIPDVLAAIKKKVNEPVIQEGVQEILNQMNGKEFDEGAINAAITATGMKTHGLAALVAYAQYKQADGKPFTHTLMREGDGITNGVAWGSLQFPDEQGMVQKMERFGMYSNGTTKGFANWKKETKNDDAYQSLARIWEGAISKIQFQNKKHEQFSNAVTNFVGSFMDMEGKITKAGRNAAKPILMTFVYGAGINGILSGYTNFVVDKIYDDIKKLIDKPNDPDAYQNVMNASELLRQATGKGIDMNNLLEFELSEKDHKRLQVNISKLYKDTLETALEQAYPELTAQRKTITEAVNRVYKMFEYEYNKARNEFLANQDEANKGVTDITREDQAKILARVKQVMPILGTYFSGDDLDSGLELFKTKAVTAKGTGSGAYTAEIKPKSGKSIKVTGKRIDYQDPGVRTMPMTVQSLDASAMYKAIAYNVLNVFDAVGSTQNNFDESLHYINKAFTDISNEYSIPSEVAKMVSRIVDNASPEAIAYAFKEQRDSDTFFDSEQMVNDLNNQAKLYDERKKNLIKGFTYSGQYFAGEDTGVVIKEAPQAEQAVVEEATNTPKTEAELRTLGSSQDTGFTQDFDPAEDITAASTQSVFERLMDGDNTGTSSEHKEHLANVLNSLVNKVMQPLKLHLAKDPNTAESFGSITGEDVYIVTGQSAESTANNQMSAGEVFVHELVHAVTTGGTIDPLVRSELNSLWKYAKKTITPFDLMQDPTLGKDTEEYKIAEARWKHMFEPTLVDGQSNHLAEFVALGLTNAQVMSALGKIPTTKATGAQGFMGKLRQAFENMLKAFRSMMVGTYGKSAKDKVEVIAARMAGIENQKKRKLVETVYKVAAPVASALTEVNNKMKEGISAIENSKTGKQASKAISMAYNDLWKSSNPAAKLLASLMNEAQGRTQQNGVFHDLKRTTQVAQQREADAVKDAIKTLMNQAFEGDLTEAAKQGITSMLFKTDFVTLLPMLEKMGIDWTTFISDDATQKKVITMIESQLTNFQKVQAENLGRFMATGENALQGALLNAKNIAQGDTKAEKMIDALASIQALQYTPKVELAKFFQAMEADNDNLDGIRLVMDMHKQFKQDAAKALFQDSEAHIIKGWIPEIHSDGIEFTTASDKEPLLESLGYVRGDELSSGRYVWTNTTGVKQGYVAGILNMGRKGAKGTKVDQSEVQAIGQSIHDTDKDSYAAGKLIIKDNKTVPEVDTAGNIVNFRYVMKDSTKAELGANTNFDDIMAGMHASIVTKTARAEGNKQIIQALIDQYYANPDADYVEVSTEGMPKEIRDMVKRAFPKDKNGLRGKLLIRPDQQDLLFGYTKYSLADMFQKDPELRNVFENIVVDTAKALLGDKAALRIRQAENVLQSFISYAKDTIVVKSGFITVMNTFSNVLLLTSQGVSLTQAMKDMASVPSYIKQYERDEKALRILQAQVNLQTGAKREATQTKIAELTDNLYNNPVKELIQGGVLTTTFEDLGEQTDFDTIAITGEYLKQHGASAKVIDPLVSTINNVTFAQGTKGYNVLSDAARYSDFIARYSLYNHLRNKGMERDAAIGEAMDVFINYDLPTHKGIQYLNDIGLLMFSKYLIRVQKIILKSFRDNPAGVIGAVLFQNMINMNEGIWKSLVGVTDPTSRISTPLDFTGMFGEDLGSQVIKTVL